MEKILTPEEKKYLGAVSRMIQSYGTTYSYIEFEYESRLRRFDAQEFSLQDTNYFDNNRDIEVPEKLKEILTKCLQYVEQNIENYDDPYFEYDVNYGRIVIYIEAVKKILKISYDYYYYGTESGGGVTYSLSDDEDLKPIFDALEEEGISNDELRYNGGGDSGYIENTFESGKGVPAVVEDFCYSALERNFGGWEINEGSSGQFDFNMDDKEIYLNHTYNTEENGSVLLFKQSF